MPKRIAKSKRRLWKALTQIEKMVKVTPKKAVPMMTVKPRGTTSILSGTASGIHSIGPAYYTRYGK